MAGIMAQWSLDRTSGGIMQIAIGVLEAATTDNVQALTMLACEQFGTNVAMSVESRQKIALLCTRTHNSAVLEFIKAQIGYRKGDSSWQLAQSDAGQRFLGLVACLQGLETWKCAEVLHDLIYSTASDKRFVPSRLNIKHLILKLEGKTAVSGFPEDVLGWALFLDPKDLRSCTQTTNSNEATFRILIPPAKAIVDLTQAFSQLARVGEEVQDIEISSHPHFAAWIIAFTKWSLGVPPMIVLSDSQTFGSQESSGVILRVTEESQEIRTRVFNRQKLLRDLIVDKGVASSFRGMVSIATYGKAKLRELFGYTKGPKYKAGLKALSLGCFLVKQHLRTTVGSEGLDTEASPEQLDRWSTPETRVTRDDIFPPLSKIRQVLHEYIGGSDDEPSPKIDHRDGDDIWNLNEVRLVLNQIRHSTKTKARNASDEKIFLNSICECVSDVMPASLFSSSDPRGVQLHFGLETASPDIAALILDLNNYQTDFEPSSVPKIFKWVLRLVGHEAPDPQSWAMSSRYDQTIYPHMFHTQKVQMEGILCLECVPGVVMKDDHQYLDVIISDNLIHEKTSLAAYIHAPKANFAIDIEEMEDVEIEQVENNPNESTILSNIVRLSPQDRFPELKLEWDVHVLDESFLGIALSVANEPSRPHFNPIRILEAASQALFVSCSHDRNASFNQQGRIDEHSPLRHPLIGDPEDLEGDSDFKMIHSNRNENARFMSLSHGVPGIIRMDSCLECCVQRAELVPAKFVVC